MKPSPFFLVAFSSGVVSMVLIVLLFWGTISLFVSGIFVLFIIALMVLASWHRLKK